MILLFHGAGQNGRHILKRAQLNAVAPTSSTRFWSPYYLRYADDWVTEPSIIAGFSAGGNLGSRLDPTIPPRGLIIYSAVFDAKFWGPPIRHTCPVAVCRDRNGLWYEEEEANKFLDFYPNAKLFIGSRDKHGWDPDLNEQILEFVC